jgi:hypothetical protein
LGVNESGEELRIAGTEGAEDSAEAHHVNTLIFKACVVALWVDGSMAVAERDHLSHLIDSIGADEHERNELRRLALHDVNRHAVLAEIEGLDEAEKHHLFDRCVAVLTIDRKVRRSELRFLSELRRSCGIPFMSYQRLAWRLASRRRIGLLILLGLAAALLFLPWGADEEDSGVPPVELVEHPELFLAPMPSERPLLEPDMLYEVVRRSVVTVDVSVDGTLHGNGSGSVIAVDALGQLYVLTNRHVIYHELPEGRQISYELEMESGVKLPALLDFYSRNWDLAVLVVPKLGGWARPVPLLLSSELRVGQRVYALGSPMGLDHTFTSGVISAFRDSYIQTDATVHSGSSGGPLFDGSAAICGVVTTTHEHKDLSFALVADTILDMLVERREHPTETTPG